MMLSNIPTKELESMVNTLDEELEEMEQRVEGDETMEVLTRMINMSRVYTATKVYLELRKDYVLIEKGKGN